MAAYSENKVLVHVVVYGGTYEKHLFYQDCEYYVTHRTHPYNIIAMHFKSFLKQLLTIKRFNCFNTSRIRY